MIVFLPLHKKVDAAAAVAKNAIVNTMIVMRMIMSLKVT